MNGVGIPQVDKYSPSLQQSSLEAAGRLSSRKKMNSVHSSPQRLLFTSIILLYVKLWLCLLAKHSAIVASHTNDEGSIPSEYGECGTLNSGSTEKVLLSSLLPRVNSGKDDETVSCYALSNLPAGGISEATDTFLKVTYDSLAAGKNLNWMNSSLEMVLTTPYRTKLFVKKAKSDPQKPSYDFLNFCSYVYGKNSSLTKNYTYHLKVPLQSLLNHTFLSSDAANFTVNDSFFVVINKPEVPDGTSFTELSKSRQMIYLKARVPDIEVLSPDEASLSATNEFAPLLDRKYEEAIGNYINHACYLFESMKVLKDSLDEGLLSEKTEFSVDFTFDESTNDIEYRYTPEVFAKRLTQLKKDRFLLIKVKYPAELQVKKSDDISQTINKAAQVDSKIEEIVPISLLLRGISPFEAGSVVLYGQGKDFMGTVDFKKLEFFEGSTFSQLKRDSGSRNQAWAIEIDKIPVKRSNLSLLKNQQSLEISDTTFSLFTGQKLWKDSWFVVLPGVDSLITTEVIIKSPMDESDIETNKSWRSFRGLFWILTVILADVFIISGIIIVYAKIKNGFLASWKLRHPIDQDSDVSDFVYDPFDTGFTSLLFCHRYQFLGDGLHCTVDDSNHSSSDIREPLCLDLSDYDSQENDEKRLFSTHTEKQDIESLDTLRENSMASLNYNSSLLLRDLSDNAKVNSPVIKVASQLVSTSTTTTEETNKGKSDHFNVLEGDLKACSPLADTEFQVKTNYPPQHQDTTAVPPLSSQKSNEKDAKLARIITGSTQQGIMDSENECYPSFAQFEDSQSTSSTRSYAPMETLNNFFFQSKVANMNSTEIELGLAKKSAEYACDVTTIKQV